ncbi:MAG: DUF1801 domain-containing protein [Tenericutes bacterium]|nr:DUF1801 domain-containing protein [Mycoplasmatota bacterium]
MYELKTKLSSDSVEQFINSIEDSKRKRDSLNLMSIISTLTISKPKMWGKSIVGYGNITYTNSTKKEYDWFQFGFSPRKNALTLYLTAYSEDIYSLADKAGLKHGKGCVYIKDIDSLDITVIKKMIQISYKGK